MHKTRCAWIANDELMMRYHDKEWGVPLHDDLKWFEFIILDAFQAGLSWRTVLHKREGFRKALLGFDPSRVASMSERDIEAVRRNPAIIRNRLKIKAAVKNARAFLAVQDKRGSFDSFIWSFTGGEVIQNNWIELSDIPASTPLSDKVSKALKKEGFSFVGTTICYSLLQAGGIVNDHLIRCFRHRELNPSR